MPEPNKRDKEIYEKSEEWLSNFSNVVVGLLISVFFAYGNTETRSLNREASTIDLILFAVFRTGLILSILVLLAMFVSHYLSYRAALSSIKMKYHKKNTDNYERHYVNYLRNYKYVASLNQLIALTIIILLVTSVIVLFIL